MAFLYEYGLFLAQVATLVVALAVIIALVTGAAVKSRPRKGQLEVTDLNQSFYQHQELLQQHLLDKKAFKKWQKTAHKAYDALTEQPKRLFVLEFNGSLDAREAVLIKSLRRRLGGTDALDILQKRRMVRRKA